MNDHPPSEAPRRRRGRRILLLTLLIVGCGLVAIYAAGAFRRTIALTKQFGGKPGYDCIRRPDSVEARLVRLKNSDAKRPLLPAPFWDNLDALETIDGPKTVEPDRYRELSELLIDDDLYERDVVSGSHPHVDLKLRFVRGSESVDVLIGVRSACVYVFRDGKTISLTHVAARSRLITMARRIFPEAPALDAADPARGLFGKTRFAIVRGATLIEAQRIPEEKFPPVALTDDEARKVVRTLLDPKTYDQGTYADEPTPNVRLRFTMGDDSTDLLVCYATRTITVPAQKEGEHWVSSFRSIEGGFSDLKAVLQKAFARSSETVP
jgi:hypothetical protein